MFRTKGDTRSDDIGWLAGPSFVRFGVLLPVGRYCFFYLSRMELDAPTPPCVALSADDLSAVVILAQSLLRVGSGIDVYCDGRFWEAIIVGVWCDGFRFRFLGQRRCGGWVRRQDFLISWRFPVRTEDDVRKAAPLLSGGHQA
jgi:hypothetical protein